MVNKLTGSAQPYFQEIEAEARSFEKITLPEMDHVKLMDRKDVKYVIPLPLLASILRDTQPWYTILEIQSERLCAYQTRYYDTADYQLYHSHHSGRLNRYKVRFRNYIDSGVSFFEIKHKSNRGRTLKSRIEQSNEFEDSITKEQAEFLESVTTLKASELEANVLVSYRRITLVHKTSMERLTIDLNITYSLGQRELVYSQFAVAEIKQDIREISPISNVFKKHHLRAGSLSKYCLGVISLDPSIKQNRFKSKFLHLKKIINQYDSLTRTTN